MIHSVTGSKGDMEGTPTVILEAGLSMKPVVSTYHAGIPEIIKHNESGFFTDEGDIDTMVKYLVELASNLRLREKFGRNLKNYIQKEYSEKINHERFVKKYSKHIFEKIQNKQMSLNSFLRFFDASNLTYLKNKYS